MAALWCLDPALTFLNHGSFGACPTAVLDYQSELRRQLEASPADFMLRQLPELLESARLEVARFLGSQPGNLAFVTNATSGVNAVLRSLDWRADDELVITSHGYNACNNVARYLGQRYGLNLIEARIPFPCNGPEQVIEAVLGSLTSRTRLVMLDHVTSPTGLIFPVEVLAGELAGRGVAVLVDGAHAPGMLELDLEALGRAGVSYYTGNLHKWCCAPKGAAVLWVAPERQPGLVPPVISHGFNSPNQRSPFLENFDWSGTFDPTAWLAAPRSLALLESEFGWTNLRRDCHQLVLAGRDLLLEVFGQPAPAPDSMLGTLAAIPLPRPYRDLYRHLYDEFALDSYASPFGPTGILRLSAFAYNTLDDYQRLASAVQIVFSRDP